jgi:parvulin-like peptidyl-prolyl isomerase
MICGLSLFWYIIGMFALTVSAQVVAKVNNEEVLQSDVDFVFDTFVLPQFQAQNPNQEFPAEQKTQVQKNILDQLVLQHLLLQEAAKVGIAVTDEVVNQRYEAFKAQRPDVPEEQVKPFIKNELMNQQMIEQEIVSKITVSDEEMQQYYEEKKRNLKNRNRSRPVISWCRSLRTPLRKIKMLRKPRLTQFLVQLNEGKDFGELAKEHSDCPSKNRAAIWIFCPRYDGEVL